LLTAASSSTVCVNNASRHRDIVLASGARQISNAEFLKLLPPLAFLQADLHHFP
jgi:hypothetical protein